MSIARTSPLQVCDL